MENSDKEVGMLSLWSWQTPNFSLTGGTVDHRLSEKEKTVSGLPQSRKELSELLDTDQFIWCYTYPNKEQWPGRVRWELKVPKHRVLKYTCNVAWHWILAHNGNDYTNPVPPKRLWHLARSHVSPPLKWPEFCKIFNDGWKNKTVEELWKALFPYKVYGDCTDVLLLHPIEIGWAKNDFDKQ